MAAASYVTFQDAAFEFGGNVQKIYEIQLPPGIEARRDAPGILSFMLHAKDADDLKFKVEIAVGPPKPSNPPVKVAEFKLNGHYFATIQELFQLQLVSGSTVAFARISGDGTLKISDVVVWFQIQD